MKQFRRKKLFLNLLRRSFLIRRQPRLSFSSQNFVHLGQHRFLQNLTSVEIQKRKRKSLGGPFLEKKINQARSVRKKNFGERKRKKCGASKFGRKRWWQDFCIFIKESRRKGRATLRKFRNNFYSSSRGIKISANATKFPIHEKIIETKMFSIFDHFSSWTCFLIEPGLMYYYSY